jgi:recombination endonuclease VII
MKKNGRPVRTTCKLEECGTEIPPRPFGKTGPHPMFCSTQHRSLYDRRYHMKRQYGMTNDEYFALLQDQNSACAICGSKDPKSSGRGRAPGSFHVDHDHVSGKFEACCVLFVTEC